MKELALVFAVVFCLGGMLWIRCTCLRDHNPNADLIAELLQRLRNDMSDP